MANTGYIINPSVIQIFTTGPNSGSVVNPSYSINFNLSSSFTSSFLCNTQYFYKIFDPENCPITGYCIAPTLLRAATPCGPDYDYVYNIRYALNGTTSSIPTSFIEYSLQSNFTGEIGISLITNTGSSMLVNVNISGTLENLPINGSSPVYFRVANQCSGSGNSSYSNVRSSSCDI